MRRNRVIFLGLCPCSVVMVLIGLLLVVTGSLGVAITHDHSYHYLIALGEFIAMLVVLVRLIKVFRVYEGTPVSRVIGSGIVRLFRRIRSMLFAALDTTGLIAAKTSNEVDARSRCSSSKYPLPIRGSEYMLQAGRWKIGDTEVKPEDRTLTVAEPGSIKYADGLMPEDSA